MAELDTGVMVQAEGGQWVSLAKELDRMNDPAVMAVQRQFEQEMARARVRARLEQSDARVEEESGNRAHVRDVLEEFDSFSADMIRLAKEPTDG